VFRITFKAHALGSGFFALEVDALRLHTACATVQSFLFLLNLTQAGRLGLRSIIFGGFKSTQVWRVHNLDIPDRLLTSKGAADDRVVVADSARYACIHEWRLNSDVFLFGLSERQFDRYSDIFRLFLMKCQIATRGFTA
jgi:hypothetical protein